MASLVSAKSKGFSVQWYRGGGERETLYLGKVPKRWAEDFVRGFERLADAQRYGESIDRKTSAWLAGLDPKWRGKLAEKGLVESIKVANLGDLVDHCRDRLKDRSGSSVSLRKFNTAVDNFFDRFDKRATIGSVSKGDAKDYVRWLQANGRRDGKGETTRIAPKTADHQVGVLRSIFDRAIDKDLLARNPFKGVTIVVGDSDAQQHVPLDVVARVLDKCSPGLALRVALARYAGLRHPTEVDALQIDWVDLPNRRMLVESIKNKRFEHKRWRETPIQPLLVPYLEDAIETAAPGERYVAHVNRGVTSTSWRNALERACKRAAVVPWSSLWNSLRGSRATDLLDDGIPEHVVVKWQNTSARELRKSYLRPTEEHFSRITGVAAMPSDQAEPKVAGRIAEKVRAL